MNTAITPVTLKHISEAVLMGSFGVALIATMRRNESPTRAFEGLAIGFFAIIFAPELFAWLAQLGISLESYVLSLGDSDSLRTLILKNFSSIGQQTSKGSGFRENWSFFSEIFRTGVWGIIASITELIFLLARFLLTVGRDALWQILMLVFPLGAAFTPIFPKLLFSLLQMSIELILWLPILAVIEITTSALARDYLKIDGDIGFHVLACEIIAILITVSIPSIAHKLISGTIHSDILDPWTRTAAVATSNAKGLAGSAQTVYQKAPAAISYATRAIGKIRVWPILLIFGISAQAQADDVVRIKSGYVTKIVCQGKLLISAVGDEAIIDLAALPEKVGCGVILRPKRESGETNLILETSSGSSIRIVRIEKGRVSPSIKNLEIEVRE